MDSITAGITLLVGGGLFAAVAALLSTRENRNKRYDDRRDLEFDVIQTRKEYLENENDTLRVENTRLRVLLASKGIDPTTGYKARNR